MVNFEMNKYEFNKAGYSSLPAIDPIILNREFMAIAEEMVDIQYWMLLCKERSDYTIFNIDTICPRDIVKELNALFHPRGKVVSIERYEADNVAQWEIWVKDDIDGAVMYKLFDCFDFIIEVNNHGK